MKLIIFAILILFVGNISAFENKGLHKLNPFPLKEWVSRTYLKHKKAQINLKQSLSTSKAFNEYHSLVEQEIGKRITDNTYFSIAAQYGESSSLYLKTGESRYSNYSSRGFSEPRFTLFSRRKWAEGEGEPIVDIAISYTPGFDNKKVGKHGVDHFNGGEILNFKVSHGSFYKFWDFNINVHYDYYGERSIKDISSTTKISRSSYSEFMAMFEAKLFN
tara:strand:- start:233 stop:886 length:654 start_codon:yes stop_codon:yes gene_type:complete